jgi:hypothetical protein
LPYTEAIREAGSIVSNSAKFSSGKQEIEETAINIVNPFSDLTGSINVKSNPFKGQAITAGGDKFNN